MSYIKIGIIGLAFHSANKGCEALAYSFLKILDDIAQKRRERYELFIFQPGWRSSLLPQIHYETLLYKLVPIKNKFPWNKLVDIRIRQCDVVFDFTAGDSFTDLYGYQRFDERSSLKEKVLQTGVPLVLGCQTYGPFSDTDVRERAAEILKRATAVFSRDWMSSETVRQLARREPITATDIAFQLPYDKSFVIVSDKKKVGINPSGLLWNGGYTKNNQFELKVDYKSYLRSVIQYLLEAGEWEVHLIPHVIAKSDVTIDNDCVACQALKEEFPEVIVAPEYCLPMDVKSYISAMDVFTGARMHATIAAFSSGVATIPFSYSRKFEGLYAAFDYKYIISGNCDSTEKAIKDTIMWIEDYQKICKEIEQKAVEIDRLSDYLNTETETVIANISKGIYEKK